MGPWRQERIHFPTTRVPLEALIRLLIDHFHIPSHLPRVAWRKLLTYTESEFLDITQRGISG